MTQSAFSPKSDISSLRFACYGFARYEKGSDLLGTAIERVVKQSSEHPQFCVQWIDAFSLPDGGICRPDALKRQSAVQVIERPLETQEYQSILQNTSCMVLPYRNSSYHARLSRVAIEAACLGIPMIYTKGGWLEDVVSEFGAGIGIRDEDVEDLIRAIGKMASEYSVWRQRAIAKQTSARQYFSGEMFFYHLFNREQDQGHQTISHSAQALT